jgi:hypothetical protein
MNRTAWRLLGVGVAAALGGALLAGAGTAAAGPAGTARPAAAPASGIWQDAQNVPGMAALNPDGTASVYSVSCAVPGGCAAGGYYDNPDLAGPVAFIADETGGSWQDAQQVPGIEALAGDALDSSGSSVSSLSCAAPGNCAAGGSFALPLNESWAFVTDETDGTWQDAQAIPGLAALDAISADVTSVSCTAPGDCTAVGGYAESGGAELAFAATQTGGSWGDAAEIPGLAALGTDIQVYSLSCATPGNCSAAGSYQVSTGSSTDSEEAFVADETGGTWQDAQKVPGTAALNSGDAGYVSGFADSVSCPAAGDCAVAGGYSGSAGNEPFVDDETDGTWGTAEQVPGSGALNSSGDGRVETVSCAAPGECAAGGFYQTADGYQAFVADESGGTWQDAQELPGTAALNTGGHAEISSLSCPAPGDCDAGGFYELASGADQLFVAEETAGSWGAAQELPGIAALDSGASAFDESLSCAAPGSCAAGGYYGSSAQAYLATERPVTATTLTLSRPTVSYGRESSERLRVTVTAGSPGRPAGSVTVAAGSVTVCVIRLGATGAGSCRLSAKRLRAGSYRLIARYPGSGLFAPSSSGREALKVAR